MDLAVLERFVCSADLAVFLVRFEPRGALSRIMSRVYVLS